MYDNWDLKDQGDWIAKLNVGSTSNIVFARGPVRASDIDYSFRETFTSYKYSQEVKLGGIGIVKHTPPSNDPAGH